MTEDHTDLYDPSKWRLTLQELLHGKLDYAVRALGGTEPFVERQLAEAVRRQHAETAFVSALNDEVVSWQVGRSSSAYYVAGIVQLIGAFTPPAGFAKCVQVVEGALDPRRLQLDLDHVQTILVTAVAALARYYPTAPPNAEADGAYSRYQAILHRLTVDPILAPLAIRQRLRLGLLRLDEPDFITDAVESEIIMRVAIDYAVEEPEPWSVDQLTGLFNACVATNRPEAIEGFLQRLRTYGVPVIENEDRVSIAPHDGVRIVVTVQPDLVATYVNLRWHQMMPRGFQRYLEVVQ